MTRLSRYVSGKLNDEQKRVEYAKALRCECRLRDGSYCYTERCRAILFDNDIENPPETCPAVPCGQCPEFTLGKV